MDFREQWHLDTRHIGRRVLVFDRADSTNTLASQLPGELRQDGLVILADEQSRGRGQHGRSWHCPAGTGVLMSVLLLPPEELRRPVLLAAWAAVSVCETIRQSIGQQARIKWPNDVLLHGRKVCGILIEQRQGVIAGIGLNVTQTAEMFEAAGLPDAGSLALFTDRQLIVADIARLLIRQLDAEYERLREGDWATLEACWKWHTGLLGRSVHVECQNAVYQGRLCEQGWDGLELAIPGEPRLRLQPEIIRHVSPLPSSSDPFGKAE
jgi:BirA family biotin operon repressor/biotin-[acetyl-CoA-carboxylase] ligase